MKKVLVLIGITVLTWTSAFAWSHEGHQVIGDVAFSRLHKAASNAVMAILLDASQIPEVTNIISAATWPDDIRDSKPPSPIPSGKFHDSKAALDFKGRFPDNTGWHFDNYPLEGVTYTANGIFSKSNDIVHEITHCIDVLEHKSTDMNSKEALVWLVHLVGDIHQPMHVACGYYTIDNHDVVKLDKTPSDPHALFSDRGGNGLKLKPSDEAFHHFWDQDMVEANNGEESKL